jgi:hypothetical protein
MNYERRMSNDEIIGRLCQTPWRFAETPYNYLAVRHTSLELRH